MTKHAAVTVSQPNTHPRGKKPIEKIVAVKPEKPQRRQPWGWKGRIHIGPEFFEPLPDDELRTWGEIE
jgi:hypothetical protein